MWETKPTGVFALIPKGMRTGLLSTVDCSHFDKEKGRWGAPLTPDGLGSSKSRVGCDRSVKECRLALLQVYMVLDAKKNIRALKVVDLEGAGLEVVDGFRNEISLLQRLQYCDSVIKMFNL